MEVERRRRKGENADVPAGFERYTKVGIDDKHSVCDCENTLVS